MKKQIILIIAIFLFGSITVLSQTPKTISGGVVNGKAQSLPTPAYPAAARAVDACGSVSVQVLINEEGKIVSAEAVSGHPLLRNAAVKAAQEAVFAPISLSDQPVKVSGILVYVFRCEEKEDASGSGNLTKMTGSEDRTIAGGVVNGKAQSLPKPAYPAAAKAVNAQGAVNVKVLIDEEGNIISAEAVTGHPLLRGAAVAAAREAKFLPTLLSGAPVKVSGIITYVFNLPKTPDDETSEATAVKDVEAIGGGMVLQMLVRLNAIDEMREFTDDLISDFSKEFENDPELSGEEPDEILTSLRTLPDMSKEKRAEVILDVKNKIFAELTPEEKWQFTVGENLGDVMTEILKLETFGEADHSKIRVSLLRIRDLTLSAPKNFPPNLLTELKEIGDLGNEKDFENKEFVERVGIKVMVFGDKIFDSM